MISGLNSYTARSINSYTSSLNSYTDYYPKREGGYFSLYFIDLELFLLVIKLAKSSTFSLFFKDLGLVYLFFRDTRRAGASITV